MAETSIPDVETSWNLVVEFDDLKLRSDTPRDQENIQVKTAVPCSTSPGMTAEYHEFCRTLSDGIIPLEDLHELVYKPLKNKYPDKFQGGSQAIEFYSVYALDGRKFYKKLSGKERDIAVQKDIFEQVKRRKQIEIYVQVLRFKLQTKLQELSLIKVSSDPAKVFVFEKVMKNIEMALDIRGLCSTTLKQLERLIETSWIIFFQLDVAKKRKKDHCSSLGYCCLNKCNFTRHTNDPSSKRMKRNPEKGGCASHSDVIGIDTGSENASAVSGEGITSSNVECSDSEESETSDWIVE